jgi:hypothetical protein
MNIVKEFRISAAMEERKEMKKKVVELKVQTT